MNKVCLISNNERVNTGHDGHLTWTLHNTGSSLVTMATQLLIPPTVSAFVSTVLSLLSLTLLLLLCVIRKKRRMEGTYRPSAEEKKQTGAAGSERPGLPLPLPKEERLI
ncbi:protein crumbs homolog 3b isoform X1 [Lates japonicus]|uniref:Protein crumbs homolog 3b isoform X1 n=1 Tax=Lates japonicus TaxID=270547 RepID=A0AAD3MWN1_LATJO|nr:protein crumbs homolog 3b isoform X1 [Lates japonicus]